MLFTNLSKAVVGTECSLLDELSTHRSKTEKTTKREDTMVIRRHKSTA